MGTVEAKVLQSREVDTWRHHPGTGQLCAREGVLKTCCAPSICCEGCHL